MSTKRVKMREQKRKREQQRKFIIAGTIVGALLVAALITLIGLDVYSRSYIMTFEGQKISVNDFRFCGLFATNEETSKSEALDTLLTFMVLEKAAKDNNLTLTQEEKDELVSYSSGLKDYYKETYGVDMSYMNTDRMAELLGLNQLRQQLQDKYTADFTVDETDYAKALAEYKQNERADYYDMPLKYIMSTDPAVIEEARQALDGGMSFDEAVATYSDYYSEETGVDTYQLKDFGLSEEDTEKVLALSPGDISDTVELEGLYGILYVESLTIPSDEEISTLYREKYIAEKKAALFDEMVLNWKDTANYQLNQKAYDAA